MFAFAEVVDIAAIVVSVCILFQFIMIRGRFQSKLGAKASASNHGSRSSLHRVSVNSSSGSVKAAVGKVSCGSFESSRSSVVSDASERKAVLNAHLGTIKKESSSGDDIMCGMKETRTHVLCRNIPNKITDQAFRANIEALTLNFTALAVPMDFEKGYNKGYAFVRFSTPEDAMAFMAAVKDMTFAGTAVGGIPIHSRKAMKVEFAQKQ